MTINSSVVSVTIPNAETESDAITIPEGCVLCAISTNEDGFDGANVGYQVQFDGTNWLRVHAVDSTTHHTTLLGATKGYVPVNFNLFLASARGYKAKLRLKAATAQTGAITFQLHFREIQ
jgi:hypothetical protein